MRNHPAILLASIIILMGGERVWAHGGSASHSSVGRGGTHARSVGLTPTRVSQMTRVQFHASPIGFGTNPAPAARMLVTTAQSVLTKPASVHLTSTAADPLLVPQRTHRLQALPLQLLQQRRRRRPAQARRRISVSSTPERRMWRRPRSARRRAPTSLQSPQADHNSSSAPMAWN